MDKTNNKNIYFALFPFILGSYYLWSSLILIISGNISVDEIQYLTILVLYILSFGIYQNIIFASISFAAFVIFAFATEFVNSGFNFINIGKLFLSLVILFSGIENQINLLKTNHEKLIKNLKDKIYLGLSIIYITFLTLNIVSQHSFSLMYIHNKDDFNKDDYKFVNSLSILETNEKMQYLFHFKNLGNNNGFFLVTNKKVLTQDHLQKVDKLNFNDLEKIEKEIISEDVSKLNLILKSGESINITIPRKRKRDEEVYFYIYNELKTLSNGA